MSHLQSLKYVTKYRFASYWYQIKEVMQSDPANVLEIGVGPNLVAGYLRQQKIRVVTMDREMHFRPYLSGTVLHLPLKDLSFDTVMSCQVLEHLPFQEFGNCLKELRRITRKKLILSLPDKTPALSLLVRMPNLIFWDFMLVLPWAFRKHIRDIKGHYWEIGERGYPCKRLIKEITGAGFSVDRTYRVPDYAYHRFFIASPV
jgi:ubiquinone/menaquinone biosynthesis C-methylase UbiE